MISDKIENVVLCLNSIIIFFFFICVICIGAIETLRCFKLQHDIETLRCFKLRHDKIETFVSCFLILFFGFLIYLNCRMHCVHSVLMFVLLVCKCLLQIDNSGSFYIVLSDFFYEDGAIKCRVTIGNVKVSRLICISLSRMCK